MRSGRHDSGFPPATMNGRRAGRTRGDENFPVASLLIAGHLRPAVKAYYAAARAADDIADDPDLPAEEKNRRLDDFEAALTGEGNSNDAATAIAARRALAAVEVPVEHATRLLRAFRRDTVHPRCADWDDLMAYCADSANPVGRFLLDLHGESATAYRESDALCTALQVLNHLQDCGDDYRVLGRIYLPGDWLADEGVPERDLGATRTSPGLRRVLDRCLAGVDALLAQARPLPCRISSNRLALEAAVVLALAEALAQALAAGDPLAGRVRISKPAMLAHAALAVLRGAWRRVRCPAPRTRQLPA